MSALIVVAVFCQTVVDEPALPAIAEAPVVQVEAFRVEHYTLKLYRQFQFFEFFLGTHSYRQRWTKFWIEAKDDRTGKSWTPWAIYEPTDFRGPASAFFPRSFSIALHGQEGDTTSRKAMIVYLFGEGMCKYFVFDLLNSAEPPENAFAMYLKPRPELDGQFGNSVPTPEGTTSRNRILMYRVIEQAFGKEVMEEFVAAPKKIKKVWWADGRWRVTVTAAEKKEYTFVRQPEGTEWTLLRE